MLNHVTENWRSSRVLKAVLTASLFSGAVSFGAPGCGDPGGALTETDLGSLQSALAPSDWNAWNTVSTANGPLTTVGAPVPCGTPYASGASGTALFTRDGQNHYSVSVMSRSPHTPWVNPWAGASDRTFTGKPACISLDYDEQSPPSSYQVLVIGRSGSLGRYYAGVLKLGASPPAFGSVPGAPTKWRDWAEVTTEEFASAPAVTIYDQTVYLVGRKSNNSMVFQQASLNRQNRNDPYSSLSWTTRTLPALPTGWTAAGDPAIASAKYGFAYPLVVTRAVNAQGTSGVFRIARDQSQQYGPWGNWVRLQTGNVAVASDPTVELNASKLRTTVYFRATDNRIYQATANVGSSIWEAFTAIKTDTFVGTPNAVGGNLGTDPLHMVYAKKAMSNQVWVAGTGIGID